MNSIPWSPVLQYATPLPMNRTPVLTVALQHKFVSSVLRYATPLPINRNPIFTVGCPFRPFGGMPHPSRSTGPCFDRRRSVSSVLRYATPPPDQQDPVPNIGGLFPPLCDTPGLVSIACSIQVGWLPRVPLPPDEHDAFRCLPMNTTHFVDSP